MTALATGVWCLIRLVLSSTLPANTTCAWTASAASGLRAQAGRKFLGPSARDFGGARPDCGSMAGAEAGPTRAAFVVATMMSPLDESFDPLAAPQDHLMLSEMHAHRTIVGRLSLDGTNRWHRQIYMLCKTCALHYSSGQAPSHALTGNVSFHR